MTDIAISKDCEPASLAEANLLYAGDAIGWAGLWQYRDHRIEIRIDGDEHAPYGQLVLLAGIVLPKLEAIEDAADAYIRGFINDGGGFYKESWKLQSLRIWWNPHSQMAGKKFEVTLSVGEDDYGQWAVRFAYDTSPSTVLRPYFFSRKQW